MKQSHFFLLFLLLLCGILIGFWMLSSQPPSATFPSTLPTPTIIPGL